ncbi:uncharacterized protein BYT42DRAFT_566648 [Radiomyces spectabilis]|uniref:uncharacterized protein n=1 Tax=Radiomyces spectabilis TaxID=64574 RepID=UPI0022204667|nr:uncharacterized protein BYT42DRAFT_566648 [Radiomyces spectabilis]KAI8381471.1 hypothetical protein BYT42DRAFT_566648 [Radiomyces spectabilis]
MTTENIHHASLTGSMPTAYRPPTAPSATSSSAASSPKPDMERFWNMMLDSSSLPLLDDTLPNPTHFDSRPNYAGEKEKSVQKMFPRSISPEIVPSSSNQSLYSGTDEEESGGSSGANGSIGDERDGHHGERSSSKDDKRRRNTAASARFRIKKKMREQALQRTANEMTEKSIRLEARVQELEREIRWLKALVVEKNESRFEKMLQDPHHARSLLGGVELTRQPDSSYQ